MSILDQLPTIIIGVGSAATAFLGASRGVRRELRQLVRREVVAAVKVDAIRPEVLEEALANADS